MAGPLDNMRLAMSNEEGKHLWSVVCFSCWFQDVGFL